MNGIIINVTVIGVLLFLALYSLRQTSRRRAVEELEDLLSPNAAEDFIAREPASPSDKKKMSLYESFGLFTRDEQRSFRIVQRLLPIGGALVAASLRIAMGEPSFSKSLFTASLGAGVGYLLAQSRLRRAKSEYQRQLNFFLPVVLERVVMAVQAGLDVVPALGSVIALEKKASRGRARYGAFSEPVTRLLAMAHDLTEAGLSFERALGHVGGLTDCIAIKHAFLHLGLAQKEGGELLSPLRELSDATQLQFQEVVEEEIAKMPVKATFPLVLTFAGLVICFVTSPILQVLSFTKSAMPH